LISFYENRENYYYIYLKYDDFSSDKIITYENRIILNVIANLRLTIPKLNGSLTLF